LSKAKYQDMKYYLSIDKSAIYSIIQVLFTESAFSNKIFSTS